MASPNSILVLGAGELGLSLLQALKAHPASSAHQISVLLRPTPPPASTSTSHLPAHKSHQLAQLSALHIPIIHGDLIHSTVATLATLFAPFETIISATGFVAGRGTQLKIARAVLCAGSVKRFFPWQFGVDYEVLGRGSGQDLFDEQLDVRGVLRGQQEKVEWVVVSTGMFMSFLFEGGFGVVDVRGGEEERGEGKKKVVRALGSWENEVTVTTVEDIGRVTAEIVFAEPRIRNQVVFMAGETVSYGRVADVVEGVLGEEVEREVWDVEALKEELARDPNDSLKKYRVVFAEGKGMSWGMEKTFNAQKGIEMVGIEQWTRENLMK